nr:alpha/beta hydrolase [Anaerolineae bacterium]
YPRLYCEETEGVDETDAQAYADAIVACRERFTAEGVDIADYHTINNANDMADLMTMLGYPEYNLFGISYGTRLALNVMRDYPDGIRSVIIDSVYPPVVDAYEEEVISAYGSFRQMFDDCVADSACNSAFPDLENRFYALIDEINATPITLSDGTALDGTTLLNMMFQWFYDATIIPYLPLMIDELANGGYSVLEALNDGLLPIYDEEAYDPDPITAFADELYYILEYADDDTYDSLLDELYEWDMTAEGLLDIVYAYLDEDDASYLEELLADVADDQMSLLYTVLTAEDVEDTQGVYDAYECYEEVPFNSVADQQALMQTVTIPPQYDSLAELDGLAESCALWQTATAPQIEDEAIFSDIPTLVYAGNYDPVTPPVWGRIAAETLSNSTYVEFRGLGHSAIDGGDCPLSIALAFIDNPTAPLDVSCVDAMNIKFVTEMPDLSGYEE